MEKLYQYAYHFGKSLAIKYLPTQMLSISFPKHKYIKQISKFKNHGFLNQPTNIFSQNILFFGPKWWGIHTGWETTIALALKSRGHNVSFVTCDQVIDICESMIFGNFGREMCCSCPSMLNNYLDKVCLNSFSLRKFLSPNTIGKINAIFDSLSNEEMLCFNYKGIPLYEIIGCSIARHFRRLDWPKDASHLFYYRRMLYASAILSEIYPVMLQTLKPNKIFLCNGKFFAEQLLMYFSKINGIDVITYERGNITNTLIFGINKPVVPFDMNAAWQIRKNKQLSEKQNLQLNEYLNKRKNVGNGMVSFFGNIIQEDKQSILSTLKFEPNKKIFVLFTNTIWDSAVYGEDTIFNNMFSWVKKAIETFKTNPEYQLIIRVHPAEVKVFWQTTLQKTTEFIAKHFPTLPLNVRVIGPESNISSYVLMQIADAGLVYSSSVGIEMSILGKPVITAANSNYLRMGFTIDPTSEIDWVNQVTKLSFKINSANIELARKFSYMMYFQCMIPFPYAKELFSKGTFELSYMNPAELKSDDLELICNGILNSTPIFHDL